MSEKELQDDTFEKVLDMYIAEDFWDGWDKSTKEKCLYVLKAMFSHGAEFGIQRLANKFAAEFNLNITDKD